MNFIHVPVFVAGGGLAGLSCAYHLKTVSLLVDREKDVGGTARSYVVGGFTFDHTGHLLHLHNDYAKKLVRGFLKNNYLECRRDAWIFSKETYTRYPFQANLFGLPEKVIGECYEGLRRARRRNRSVRGSSRLSFFEWSRRLFGDGISRHFMFPYNKKLWGVSPLEMTSDWCGGFVPRPRLEDVLAGAVSDNEKAFGYNVSFLYPRRGGIHVLAEKFAESVENLRLGEGLKKTLWKEKTVVLESGDRVKFKNMVSTLPLPELLKNLDPFPEEIREPLEKLRWRSVLCLNLGVKRPAISGKSWIYFPEKKFPFYRAGFPMNFTPHAVPRGCSSMYVEVSYPPGAWGGTSAEKASLFRRVRAGLAAAGIVKSSDEFPVVSFLPIRYAYVVYNRERPAALSAIFRWLGKNGIRSIGRYGAWKYSFMEEAILDGKAAAEALSS